jgi:anaerobic magnesium-protoporphyrin IX monomethyl ester cyclase
MTRVTLVYPYFRPSNDNSIFRFPPLGLGHIAAYLKKQGISVQLVDCTSSNEAAALEKIGLFRPQIIGIQIVFSMKKKAIRMAKLLRRRCRLLVAGRPLPTVSPEDFLKSFDVVVVGEGEETMLQLVNTVQNSDDAEWRNLKGIAYLDKGKTLVTSSHGFLDLDTLPFPSRELFDNQAYKDYC